MICRLSGIEGFGFVRIKFFHFLFIRSCYIIILHYWHLNDSQFSTVPLYTLLATTDLFSVPPENHEFPPKNPLTVPPATSPHLPTPPLKREVMTGSLFDRYCHLLTK